MGRRRSVCIGACYYSWWSAAILTLNYVTVPGIPQRQIDPTFIASVFTTTLATFGVQASSKKKDEDKDKKSEEKKDAKSG